MNKIMKNKKYMFVVIIALLFLVVAVFTDNSKAIETSYEEIIVSMPIADDRSLLIVSQDVVNSFLNGMTDTQYFFRELYTSYREKILDRHPNIDITLFDSHFDSIENIINDYMEEVKRIRYNTISAYSAPFSTADSTNSYFITSDLYGEVLNSWNQTVRKIYDESAKFMNNNRDILVFTEQECYDSDDYGQCIYRDLNHLYPEFQILFHLLDRIGDIQLISAMSWGVFSEEETKRNAFLEVYNEIYRQLTYIEDDSETRQMMIAKIFFEANINWRNNWLPELIPIYADHRRLMLRNFHEVGFISVRHWGWENYHFRHHFNKGRRDSARKLKLRDISVSFFGESEADFFSGFFSDTGDDFLSLEEIMSIINEMSLSDFNQSTFFSEENLRSACYDMFWGE